MGDSHIQQFAVMVVADEHIHTHIKKYPTHKNCEPSTTDNNFKMNAKKRFVHLILFFCEIINNHCQDWS